MQHITSIDSWESIQHLVQERSCTYYMKIYGRELNRKRNGATGCRSLWKSLLPMRRAMSFDGHLTEKRSRGWLSTTWRRSEVEVQQIGLSWEGGSFRWTTYVPTRMQGFIINSQFTNNSWADDPISLHQFGQVHVRKTCLSFLLLEGAAATSTELTDSKPHETAK